MLKTGVKKEVTPDVKDTPKQADKPFTPEQLRAVWLQFAEQRKPYQMEYHMLLQEYDFIDNKVIVHLHNNFQESLLNTIKLDLLTYLRDALGNNSLQLGGEFKTVIDDDRKVLYTNREKFDHLMEKNPLIRELKDKFGLDTDF